jgi:hypothetical protein
MIQREPGSPFDIYIESRSSSLIKKLEKDATPLLKLGIVRTGIMGFDYWSLESHIQGSSGPPNRNLVRIITNSQMEPFRFIWGKKIRLYKDDLFDPRIDINCDLINDSTREFFRKKKVIMRGIGKRTTAAWDDEGYAILVAVHGFVPQHIDGFFITGLLNSELFNWLHRVRFYAARIPKGSLRYPVSFWENLPIQTSPPSIVSEIAILAQRLAIGGPLSATHFKELNDKVMELYCITEADLERTE